MAEEIQLTIDEKEKKLKERLERIQSMEQEVLDKEFPELAAKIELHIPDEKSRRVGQSVAAASLPMIG